MNVHVKGREWGVLSWTPGTWENAALRHPIWLWQDWFPARSGIRLSSQAWLQGTSQYLPDPNTLDQSFMLWSPWQSDKACGLLLGFLRIVKGLYYIEKLSNSKLSPWKITPKNITRVLILPWKPLHSRSPFLHVWCFQHLIWTAGAAETEGSLWGGSDISCSQPPENYKL